MKKLWKLIIQKQNDLIDLREKLIGQGQKQIAIWLDKPPCWMRALRFIFISSAIVIFGGLIILFYLAHPVGASGLGALIAALIGGYFLYRRTQAAEQTLNVERFTRAIDHLTNKDLFVRLGGIIGLEQIANIYK